MKTRGLLGSAPTPFKELEAANWFNSLLGGMTASRNSCPKTEEPESTHQAAASYPSAAAP
jgi:hypothetical protein